MDGSRAVLELIRDRGLVAGRLRGFFHLVIGRALSRGDGTILSTGVTWRELSQLLKLLKFDRDLVKELDADPDSISPKDREKFWYVAISLAKVDSAQARLEAEELAGLLKPHGILVGSAPGAPPASVRNSQSVPPKTPKKRAVELPEEAISPLPTPPVVKSKKKK